MRPEDRLSGQAVGGKHEDSPIQATRSTQGRIDIPRLVRRRQHIDALVAVTRCDSVEFLEQLGDNASHGCGAHPSTTLSETVDLVEKHHARGILASSLKLLVKVEFTLAEVRIEHIRQLNRKERCAELAGKGSREIGLAASRRPIQQQPAS